MIEVEVPELGIVEFPDDTTPQVMEDTLSRHFKREELGKQMEQTRKERKLTDFAQRAAQIGEAAIEPLTPSGMMNQPFRLVNVPDAYQAGRPLISLPKPTGTGVLSGLGQLATQTVEGFTTPEMIVTGAAFPASPVARALVAGEMAATLPESIAAGAETMRSPKATAAQKVVGAGTPLVTAAFVRGIGKTPEWLPEKGVENAIPVRSTEAVPLEVPPGDRQAVGARVPEPEKAPSPQVQEVPPVAEGTGGQAQGEVLLKPTKETGTKIVAVASRLGDVVETGNIHLDAERNLREKLGITLEDPRVENIEHGFLDDKGNFLDREQAYALAEKANQLKGPTEDPGFLGKEDLKPISPAKPSLLAQEKAPQPAAPEAALGESSKGVVEPTSATPPPATTTDKLIQSKEQVAQPEVVGMGGATAGEKPAAAQIEQLTEAFKGVESEKAPLIDRVKESFRIGENSAATKDALSKAVNGLKNAGDYIITKWRGIPDVDSFRRAEGELSGQLETRGWRVREWVKQARKAVPSKRTQAAIAKWVDSGGNRSALELGLAETKPEYKQAYQDALNLQGDLLTAAENIRNYFDSRLQEAVDAGVLKEGVEDYIHRIYESRPDVAQKAIARLQSGLLKPNPSLIKKRVFDYDWEAEKLGYRPVQSFIQRISAYEAALSKAIASREFIKKATTMKAADGRPVVDVKGVGIPIEEEGVREGTLIKPQFNPAKANDPGTENYRGDYVNKEFPSLSKWKWVSSDAAGKPIFVQGDVAIHPDYAPRITALLEPSRIRYGKYGKVIRPVLKASSTIKQTMLSLSGFHNVQILVHGMEHKVMPWKLVQKIDFADPNVDALLKGGVTLGGDFYGGYAPEGLFGTALTHKIPWLGPLAESYQTWLFQSFIPRMKLTMALNALERNRARFSGQMTDEQIAFKTAYEANSAFGELNYILLERSKTTQDLARLLLLAPDFLEARGRFALEGLEKGGKSKVPGFGNEQRAALLLGAITMYITARVANKILDDQYHFEPENLFSIVYKNHSYSLRTVQGDILHLIEHPLQFWMNRLNPGITRPLLQIATGRDYFGRKRTPLETLADTAVNMIPISLRHGRERTIWESFANSFGVNARRYNATDDAFKLAQKWKAEQGIQERGEFIYDSEKDPLRPLKIALSSSDDVAAAGELKKLFDSGVKRQKLNDYFNRYARMPFTGSKSNDRKWMETLNADDRKTVEAAIEHKKAIRQLYWNALGIYDSKPEKP